jgi:hypothetical protein
MQAQEQGFQRIMSDPTKGPLEQHVVLAVQTATWGALALLAWFFPIVGFVVLLVFTLVSASHFTTAFQVHQALQKSDKKKEVKDDSDPYEQLALIDSTGTVMGAEREVSVRENLPEGKA